ncbi:MAG: alanine--tRNA ligase [Planctomycetes bacterium]|nr:alanine--tRNA ligase [Planctomycetota bacterium]
MKANEIRQQFLDFFQEKQHTLVPSSPVVPQDDPTLMFANAGMNQFKDIFTGKVKPSFPRATTAQKCIRAGGKHNDLDNVGLTTRHLTFFEMLGNFSFGDYFKERAIELAWELVVDRFGLPPDRLWVTVFHEDDEARDLWRRISGLPAKRVVGLGEKDNYWSMGDVGPCGPCSEILFDRGEEFGEDDVENGERFFEFWNLVFMQFEQSPGKEKVPLPRPSIDTGMGLERMAMILQDVPTVFELDSFQRIVDLVVEISGKPYSSGPEGIPHRVLSDHIRSLVFSLADGATPSNEGRGYVIRRILRRAALYGRKIYTEGTILHRLVGRVVEDMEDTYPEIRRNEDFIEQMIRSEEERFAENLDTGIDLFESLVGRLQGSGATSIPGDEVFRLYDTHGFPVDLVQRMADERSLEVDLEGFEGLMASQREKSRQSTKATTEAAAQTIEISDLPETRFLGYDGTQGDGEILAVARVDGEIHVVLSDSPFYGEAGGQIGDVGVIESTQFRLAVTDTQKQRGRLLHACHLVAGDSDSVKVGEVVSATVDADRRRRIERNHSATHLLHAALRQIAGTHVRQKGSLVSEARLRFDVTHFGSFTVDELREAEELVRQKILDDVPVETFETDYDDAVARGAMALFGEKYGDVVRVVRMGDFSMELCGGTHVARTAQIGPFVLLGEGSVASGVRRLEAVTAQDAESYHRDHSERLLELGALLKVAPDGVVDRVRKILTENKDLKNKAKEAVPVSGGGGDVRREQLGDVLFIGAVLPGVGGKQLRENYDRFKKESHRMIAVLIGESNGKLGILVAVSSELAKEGRDAREIFAPAGKILGAKGGGRPEMIQAGGKANSSKLVPALEAALEATKKQLGLA